MEIFLLTFSTYDKGSSIFVNADSIILGDFILFTSNSFPSGARPDSIPE